MAKSIYICDTQNNKIVEKSVPGLTTVGEMTEYTKPSTKNITMMAINSTHLFYYIDDDDYSGRLYKVLLSDYGAVQDVAVQGLVSAFPYLVSMHADDDYLYISNIDEDEYVASIVRLDVDDLSFVDSTTTYEVDSTVYNVGVHAIRSEGDYLYLSNIDGFTSPQFSKLLKSDMTGVAVYDPIPPGEFYGIFHISTDGSHVYFYDIYDERLKRINCSDLTLDGIWMSAIGIAVSGLEVDETYLYTLDPNSCEIKKFLKSDLSFVSSAGSPGSGDDNFDEPYMLIISGSSIYMLDQYNLRIVERLVSDLSYVSKFSHAYDETVSLFQPAGICTDGTYFYVAHHYNDGDSYPLIAKFEINSEIEDAIWIAEYTYFDDIGICVGCATDGTYVYITLSDSQDRLLVLDANTMEFVDDFTVYDGSTSFNNITHPCCDDSYLYILSDEETILKFELYSGSGPLVFVDELTPDVFKIAAITCDSNDLYISEYEFVI